MVNLIEENQKLRDDNQYLHERLKKTETTLKIILKENAELKKNLDSL